MATPANMKGVFPLMLVIVVLALHGDEVQFHVNPGLQFRIWQRGFDYASGVTVDKICEAAKNIDIPDVSGSTSVAIGNVDYGVTNIHVTSVIKPSSNFVVSPDRITWTLSNMGISVSGDWRYSYKKWFVRIRDSGSFTGSVSGASVSLTVSLGLDATGHPTISGTGCSCSISSVSIKLRGGASWLYNLFTGFVEKPIRNRLQTQICEAARNVINGKVNYQLASFPVQMVVDGDWLFDYRFLSPPDLQMGYLDTKHKAAFSHKDNLTDPPIQAEPFPTATTSNQMLTIWVSDYVANTIGYAIYRQNLLRYILTYRILPDELKGYLNTTCSPEASCLGNMFPKLSRKYPNSFVEVKMAVSKAPITNIFNSQIQVTLSGVMTCQIRHSDDLVVEIVKINVDLEVSIAVTLKDAVLRCNVASIIPTVEVVSSSVGSIPSGPLSEAFDTLCNLLLVPLLTEKGQEGIPIPLLRGVKLTNTDLKMRNRCLQIATDVQLQDP